jgi:flagellar biosynthesis/type III secretory pathway protein FliH
VSGNPAPAIEARRRHAPVRQTAASTALEALIADLARTPAGGRAMPPRTPNGPPASPTPPPPPRAIDGILFLDDLDETPSRVEAMSRAEQDARAADEARAAATAEAETKAREAARSEGFADGFAAGRMEAGREDAAAARDALVAVTTKLDTVAAAARVAADEAAHALGRLLLAAFGAAFPALSAAYGDAEAAALARTLLPALGAEPSVVISAAPRAASLIEAYLDAAGETATQSGVPRIRVVPTDTLPPGDLRVAWDQGEAIRDARALWAAIEAMLVANDTADPTGEKT